MSVHPVWFVRESFGSGAGWDPARARANLRQRGVDFADAVAALEDEHAITIHDELTAVNEQRILTLGRDARGRTIVVAYIRRGESIRIVSARRARPHERRQYAEAGQ
jgi:uncharacterized DUF497 family protein